jgi:hypothetical protein
MRGSTTFAARLFRAAFVVAVLLGLMSGGALRSLADDHPQGDFTLTNPVVVNTARGPEQGTGTGTALHLGRVAELGLPEDYGLRNTAISVRTRHQLQLSEVNFEYSGPLYFEKSNGKADFTTGYEGRSRRIVSRGSESIKGSGTYDERTGEIKGSFSGEYSMYYEADHASGYGDPDVFDITSRFSGEFHGVLEMKEGAAGAPSATSVVIAFTGSNSSTGKFAFGIAYDSGGGYITHGPYDSYFEQEFEVLYEVDIKGMPGDTGVVGAGEDTGASPSPPGSKIPGPGSWWEWLVGTVVAGAIAAGAGLTSTIFGGVGLTPTPTAVHPGQGTAAAAAGLTITPPGGLRPTTPDSVLISSSRGITEGIAVFPQWVLDRAGDAGSWVKEKAQDAGEWAKQRAGDAGAWILDRAGDAGSWAKEKAQDAGEWAKDRLDYEKSSWPFEGWGTYFDGKREPGTYIPPRIHLPEWRRDNWGVYTDLTPERLLEIGKCLEAQRELDRIEASRTLYEKLSENLSRELRKTENEIRSLLGMPLKPGIPDDPPRYRLRGFKSD